MNTTRCKEKMNFKKKQLGCCIMPANEECCSHDQYHEILNNLT
jgi:hypothetical protein